MSKQLLENKDLTKQELENKDRLMTVEEARVFWEEIKKEQERNTHEDAKKYLFWKWDNEFK